MKQPTGKQITISASCLILAVLLLIAPGTGRIGFVDDYSDRYFEDTITKAAVTFAVCKVINSSVSLVKESSLELEPAGVGVSIEAGQLLDPLDDLVERFSNLLLTSIASLGLQKIMHSAFVLISPVVIGILLLVCSVLMLIRNKKSEYYIKMTVNILFIVLVTRFFLPISAYANGYLYDNLFKKQVEDLEQKASFENIDYKNLSDFRLPEIDGIMGTVKNSAAFVGSKASQLGEAFGVFFRNMGGYMDYLVDLSVLYFSMFVIQILLLPLLMFYLMIKLVKISKILFDAPSE